jgi:hypothetical protein
MNRLQYQEYFALERELYRITGRLIYICDALTNRGIFNKRKQKNIVKAVDKLNVVIYDIGNGKHSNPPPGQAFSFAGPDRDYNSGKELVEGKRQTLKRRLS